MDTEITNREICLRSRPGIVGEPSVDNFSVVDCPYPSKSLSEGEVIVKSLYISVGPIMRYQMNEVVGIKYFTPWKLGKRIEGSSGIGIIVQSESDEFRKGDLVMKSVCCPWSLYFTAHANSLEKIDEEAVGGHLPLYLSCLGLIGIAAFLGVKEKAHIISGSNQTVVVSTAAGACGSIAGQVFKLQGCGKLIGICGSDVKCNVLTSELGFDAAIDYKTEDVECRLAKECPSGIDAYFDNVGGDISNIVISQMNDGSHVVFSGQVSEYNKQIEYPHRLKPEVARITREKGITREMFAVFVYKDKFEESRQQLREWVSAGKLKIKETVEEGLENTPKAFVGMMNGENVGKMYVHVADP